ncbi:MAG: translocation/assembly module TamB [Prevotella sp.]|nr:translocation/assembly module TamB [Prevotella sp.]
MKILKRIISVVIWTVIALNLLSAGILHLPGVQQFVGGKVAAMLEDQLGTKVTVGQIDIGLLNRIIIDNVLIYDQQRKEMLRVSRLSVKIDYMPLAEGKIHISSAQLFGAHAHLYRKNSQTAPNFQFVIDSLASKDTTSQTPLDVRINTFIIRNSSVSYDQHDIAPSDGLFNPAHLKVNGLSGHINLKALTDDSLNINVKRLGFSEQSGLTVNRLAFRFYAGKKNAMLENFQLQMPSSNLRIDTLTANYQLNEKGLKPGTLVFSGRINDTSITPSDLRCFELSLKNFQRPIAITTMINGTDQQIHVPDLQISTSEKDIDINVNGWLEHWDKQPAWHLQMNQIALSETSIDFLSKAFQLPKELTRVGLLQMTGTFDGNRQGEVTLNSQIHTGVGDVDIQMTQNSNHAFKGTVNTQGINLKQILDNEKLGQVVAQLNMEGTWHHQQKPDIKVEGTVGQLDYNGYSFGNIAFNGAYVQKAISGQLSIDDPNLQAQVSGELTEDLFEQSPQKAKRVKIEGVVNRFSPAATRLTEQFGNAEFSGNIDADFTAHNLNDAQGSLRISNFTISGTEQHKPYQLDNLILSSGYQEGIHFMSLKSDFADAELKGHFDYGTLTQSFVNLIGSKLPTLPGLPPINKGNDNNFSLRLLMSKTDWLKRFFDIDLTLGHPLSLTATINDFTNQTTIDGDLPSFAYNGSWYSNGFLRVTSPSDTLKCDLGIQKIMDDGKHMTIGLQANAANNIIRSSLNWDNHSTTLHMGGQLNSVAMLYKNQQDIPEAHVRIQPSHIILNDGTWNLEPSDIFYHDSHLLVDHFSIHRGQEHIVIDGIASRSASDTLTVDLKEVEVAYILDLVDFHSVEFSGKATGKAKASSLFQDFAAKAHLMVHDFKFEDGRMGVLDAHADWNKEKEQIDIHAIANDGPDAKTLIDGYVSPVHNTIDLAIHADGTYIDFMHSFTRSFLSDVTGHADGDARVAGTLDNINLTGKLVVDGEASVIPLNTTYRLERDTVVMIPDDIRLTNIPIYDREGNQAFLSGGIHHQHLTNLSFDLAVKTDKLLAYDFKEFGDNIFYGTIYAAGNVTIHGLGNDVIIDCDVTPLQNSVFVYNAATPDAISSQEFIEWIDPSSSASMTSHSSQTNHASPSRAMDTDIYINFLINATPEATLRLLMDANTNDYINLNGDGTIRATFHNKGAFNMFGTYTVDHGTYGVTIQNIIKKNFTFNKGGTIVFGGDPYQAALNLQAVYTVNGVSLSDLNIGNSFTNNTIRVNCLMNISGQPVAPQVDFDFEMPTVNADEQQMVRSIINGQQEMNQQVVYLLAIGRFYNQGANNNNDQQSDPTSLAMQSLLSGTLSTHLNTLLSQVIKNENWNFGANISTGNEGWHNAEYEGIINGRMLNNRLLFNGQFGYRDNATKANPSFIGDFDVQYLLYPNGNLALKVYNQTNDRYFTKSSLNTQGIGIIMKKDFNGLRELFSSKKKKKSSATDIQEDHTK